MSRHPISINTSDWPAFGVGSHDAKCERERKAATRYTLDRLRRARRTGADEADIMVGMLMAIVQAAYTAKGNSPDDGAREGLHDALDYAWLQCRMMLDDPPLSS